MKTSNTAKFKDTFERKNTWLLPFVSFLILGLIVILSLTNPFFGVSVFLEKLANPSFQDCNCLCPWWLFVILQISVSYLIYKYFRNREEKYRKKYILSISIVALIIFFLHLIIHNIFVKNGSFIASIYCPWFWLITLIFALIFSLFNPNKKED